METVIAAVIGVIGTLLGVGYGARLMLWVEREKGRLRWIDDKTVRVDWVLMRRGKGMWIIPGEGLLDIPQKLCDEASHHGGRVALICRDVTPENDHMRIFEATQIVVL